MKEYRLQIEGDMAHLEPMERCERCPEVVDSEAAMCAVIKALRERIDGLEGRIKELEKRPIVTAEPIMPDLWTYYDIMSHKPVRLHI